LWGSLFNSQISIYMGWTNVGIDPSREYFLPAGPKVGVERMRQWRVTHPQWGSTLIYTWPWTSNGFVYWHNRVDLYKSEK
jgi:hypothetical protein